MIRNLKILVAAAMALAAFGAIGASGAQAAEFHCSVEPCRFTLNPDGTGKTAHHVFVIDDHATEESISFTCPRLTGEGRSETKTSTSLTVTNLKYDGPCTVAGSTGVEVFTNGCDYNFTAAGHVSVNCPENAVIEIKSETGCIYTIGDQETLEGVTYHNLPEGGGKSEVTVSTNVHGIAVAVDGTKGECLIDPNGELEGTYTTGNTIVTAETEAGVMAEGWWE